MDVVKLSTGVTDRPGTEVTKSNVVPIRSSTAAASAGATSAPGPEDRFTRSSDEAVAADGVTDTVTLSSVAASAAGMSSRDARVARTIEAVQNGTYRVDSKAVANAMLAKLATQPGTSAKE